MKTLILQNDRQAVTVGQEWHTKSIQHSISLEIEEIKHNICNVRLKDGTNKDIAVSLLREHFFPVSLNSELIFGVQI